MTAPPNNPPAQAATPFKSSNPQIPIHPTPASPPTKQNLKSWWRTFKVSSRHQEQQGKAPFSRSALPSQSFFAEDFTGQCNEEQSSQSFLQSVINGDDHVPVNRAATEAVGPNGGQFATPRRASTFDKLSDVLVSPTKKAYAILRTKTASITDTRPQGIFGVPLRQSITYANVAISLVDEDGNSYIYGYVPIVVAKCGVFLKEKATGVEGIFRLSGSEKRIKELKAAFDSPDRYGKGLVWDGYTVHDAANVLRRYLNDLPEPVVPLDLYEKFREPLRGATKAAVGDAEGPQLVDNFDMNAAIIRYQQLITELPPLNRQLMLYILDLLAVFAAKSDENRMNSQNLAAIFQPGMLSHPAHNMAPEEYRLNQCVIIFLIENQDHFLIGMQGTEADEKTRQEVQSGTPAATPVTPNSKRTSSGVARSSSNASAGAESVARDGKIRRNRSVSSRHSRQSNGGPTPESPAAALTVTPTSGLGRSNTLPSKKSPALAAGRFSKRTADQGSSPVAPLTPLSHAPPADLPPTLHEVTTPPEEGAPQFLAPSAAAAGTSQMMVDQGSSQPRMQEKLLELPQEAVTPSKERKLPSLFQRTPSGDHEGRQPNKLRKKRLPGSANPSAHSSVASLTHSAVASPSQEISNPMEAPQQPAPASAPATIEEAPQAESAQASQTATVETPSEPTPRGSQIPTGENLPASSSGGLLKPLSRPASLHSSFNEGSDLDQVDDPVVPAGQLEVEKDKKRRWRLSRRKDEPSGAAVQPPLASPKENIGGNTIAGVSTSSVGSGSLGKPRQSMAAESSEPTLASDANSELTKENEKESKNFIGRLKSKFRDAKDNHERHKSPPGDRSSLSGGLLPSRGKSLDIKRATEEENKPAPPTSAPQDPKSAQ